MSSVIEKGLPVSAESKGRSADAPAAAATIDGFHLVIDALKLNDIDTIFGLPGIPITDLTRMAQAEGMRGSRSATNSTPAMPPQRPAS